MENNKNKVRVKSLFPIRDKEELNATIESFEWDFTKYGLIYLYFNQEKICMKCIGYSNIRGMPVITLTLADPRYKSIKDICIDGSMEIYVERIL